MNFVIKGVYSFRVHPVAVLGTAFSNVTVVAIFDQETANSAGFDTVAQHAMVYPSLPAGTPNDPSAYSYIKVKLPNGKTQILGLPWIDNESIELVELGTISLKILNVANSDMGRIVEVLAANGFNAANVEFH